MRDDSIQGTKSRKMVYKKKGQGAYPYI